MDTGAARAPGSSARVAPTDAALINGHKITYRLPWRKRYVAPTDAALINGHGRGHLRPYSARRRRATRRSLDQWTQQDSLTAYGRPSVAPTDAALINGHLRRSTSAPVGRASRQPTQP